MRAHTHTHTCTLHIHAHAHKINRHFLPFIYSSLLDPILLLVTVVDDSQERGSEELRNRVEQVLNTLINQINNGTKSLTVLNVLRSGEQTTKPQ